MVNFSELYKRGTKLTISEIEKAMHEINNRQGMSRLIDYASLGGCQVPKIYVLCAYDIQGETCFHLYETDLNGLSHIQQALNGLFSSPSSIPKPIISMLEAFVSSTKRKKRIKTASWGNPDSWSKPAGLENRLVVMAIKGGLSG